MNITTITIAKQLIQHTESIISDSETFMRMESTMMDSPGTKIVYANLKDRIKYDVAVITTLSIYLNRELDKFS